jgi:hypothetical protein
MQHAQAFILVKCNEVFDLSATTTSPSAISSQIVIFPFPVVVGTISLVPVLTSFLSG